MKLTLKAKEREFFKTLSPIIQVDISLSEGKITYREHNGEREEIELKDIEAIRIED